MVLLCADLVTPRSRSVKWYEMPEVNGADKHGRYDKKKMVENFARNAQR